MIFKRALRLVDLVFPEESRARFRGLSSSMLRSLGTQWNTLEYVSWIAESWIEGTLVCGDSLEPDKRSAGFDWAIETKVVCNFVSFQALEAFTVLTQSIPLDRFSSCGHIVDLRLSRK